MNNSSGAFHASNSDIMDNCLAILDTAKPTQKHYLKSSHGIARRAVDRLKDKARLSAELDDFAHCKDIY